MSRLSAVKKEKMAIEATLKANQHSHMLMSDKYAQLLDRLQADKAKIGKITKAVHKMEMQEEKQQEIEALHEEARQAGPR